MKKTSLFNKKSFKYGSYSVALTVVIIAVVVLVNAILGFDVVRKRVRFDITEDQMFSISTQTKDFLKELKQDVDIYILTPENEYGAVAVTETLSQYNIHSGGKVKIQYVDLDRDPTFISKNLDPDQVQGIQPNSIVVKSNGRIKVLTNDDFVETSTDYYTYGEVTGLKVEQAFTSAIKSVSAEKVSKVYFVSGHGELDPSSYFKELKSTITLNNYDIGTLALNTAVPEDADVLIFTSPTSDLLVQELEYLSDYLENGGDALFLFDVSKTEDVLPNFNKIFNRYYLRLNNDSVYEYNQQNYLRENFIILPQVYSNEVTKNLNADSVAVYLPGSRSIGIMTSDKDYVKNYAIFSSTNNSEAYDLATEGESRVGPFCLGALGEIQGMQVSRIALIGNATFVSDSVMQQLGDNGKRYVISALNWMTEKADNSIMIPAKSLAARPLNINEQTRILVFIFMSGVLPLAIIGAGVFVWLRRKNL